MINAELTHNPYFESEILGWYSIHNFGEKNISIGMFGKLDDAVNVTLNATILC